MFVLGIAATAPAQHSDSHIQSHELFPTVTGDARVDKLLSEMTLVEKISMRMQGKTERWSRVRLRREAWTL